MAGLSFRCYVTVFKIFIPLALASPHSHFAGLPIGWTSLEPGSVKDQLEKIYPWFSEKYHQDIACFALEKHKKTYLEFNDIK